MTDALQKIRSRLERAGKDPYDSDDFWIDFTENAEADIDRLLRVVEVYEAALGPIGTNWSADPRGDANDALKSAEQILNEGEA